MQLRFVFICLLVSRTVEDAGPYTFFTLLCIAMFGCFLSVIRGEFFDGILYQGTGLFLHRCSDRPAL